MDAPGAVPNDAPPPYTPRDSNAVSSPVPVPAEPAENPSTSNISLRGGYIRRNTSRQSDPASNSPAPALDYFEQRGKPARQPSPTIVINRAINQHTSSHDLSFPFSPTDCTCRDVTQQDWIRYTSSVITALSSQHGSTITGPEQASVSQEERSRRIDAAEDVIAEWNEGFWQPRGIHCDFAVDYRGGSSPTPSYRTVSNAQGDIIGTAPFQAAATSPFPGTGAHAPLPPPQPLQHAHSMPFMPPIPQPPPMPHQHSSPFSTTWRGPPQPGMPHGQSPFGWARGLLGRGGGWGGMGGFGRGGGGLGRGGSGLTWRDHHHNHPMMHHGHHLHGPATGPSRPQPRHRRSSGASSIVSVDSAASVSSTSSSESSLSSDSDVSLSSFSSDEISIGELDNVRQALAAFRLDPTNRQHLRTGLMQLRRDMKEQHRKARRDGRGARKRENREAFRTQLKAVKSEYRSLRKEVKMVKKSQKKEKKAERKLKKQERKLARKEAKQRRRGNVDPMIDPIGNRKEIVPPLHSEKQQVSGIVENATGPPPTYPAAPRAGRSVSMPDDEKAVLREREQEQVSSVVSSLGLEDSISQASTYASSPIPTPATTVRSYSPPRPTSRYSARSPDTSPDRRSPHDIAAEQRALALARAAEDRALALERAMQDRERAAEVRERALKRAAEDRARAEERAERDRARAHEQRDRDLERAARQREKALERAAKERGRAEKHARKERERAEKAACKRGAGRGGVVEREAEGFQRGESSREAAQRNPIEEWGENFGRGMGAWGEQFGRNMEQWGQGFGRNMEAWGGSIADRTGGRGDEKH